MKDEYKIYIVYLLTIIFLLVIGTVCNGQTSLTDKEFNKLLSSSDTITKIVNLLENKMIEGFIKWNLL